MIAILLKAGKLRILLASGALLVLTASLDYSLGRNVSLAALYIVPTMLAALVLRPAETFALAILCSYLRSIFETPGSSSESVLRFVSAVLAYFVGGLFVTELVRNHEVIRTQLERIQVEAALRRLAEEQLRFLVESSPAAILTVDEKGIVLASNNAANSMLMNDGGTLAGRPIGQYLNLLGNVLNTAAGRSGLRTSAQSQGRRENGEIFAAHMWFSSYASPQGRRLAAIVVDSSDELRAREEQGLREVLRGNRIVAAAFSHEVRNLCAAMQVLCSNLQEKHDLSSDPDLNAMSSLLNSAQIVSAALLQHKIADSLEPVSLREVLDNLHIVVEAEWRDIGGHLDWHIPDSVPEVLADPHGLLQVLMNMAQNSCRAVQSPTLPPGHERRLMIHVTVAPDRVLIRVADTGSGVADPRHLFQAFQPRAEGSGLGLYVSRSIVRSFGGDLRYQPSSTSGAVFVVELQPA